MTAFDFLFSDAMAQQLGWVLVHFVWQGTAIAILLAGVLAVMKKAGSSAKYTVACGGLLLMACAPVITMMLVEVETAYVFEAQPMVESVYEPIEYADTTAAEPIVYQPMAKSVVIDVPEVPLKDRLIAQLEGSLGYIVMAWALGVFALSLWHLGGWTQVTRLRKRMVKPVEGKLKAKMLQLASAIGVDRGVELLESALVAVPTVVGWLRPVILLPASAISGLSSEQLEAILAHELAHIKRCDWLVNVFQVVIETLGFYHPAVWWVSNRIRAERENCCDDIAVSVTGDRLQYARALTEMEELRHNGVFAIAATGSSLFDRIRRLLGKDSTQAGLNGWAVGAMLAMVIIAIAMPVAFAMSSGTNSNDDGMWREHFDTVYRLEDGEVLKRIKPPFITERKQYYLAENMYDSEPVSEIPARLKFYWDGKLDSDGEMFCDFVPTLGDTLSGVIGINTFEHEIAPDILNIPLGGDWIVRKGASKDELLTALTKIVQDETGRDINFVKKSVAKDRVLIASGKYKHRSLNIDGVKDKNSVYLYFDPEKLMEGSWGGGCSDGSFDEFLRWVGNSVGLKVVNSTEGSGNVRLSWREHDAGKMDRLRKSPPIEYDHRLQLLLGNISKQTGLKFVRESGANEKWFTADETLANSDVSAADLVRSVRASENWVHHVDSLYLRLDRKYAGLSDEAFTEAMKQYDAATGQQMKVPGMGMPGMIANLPNKEGSTNLVEIAIDTDRLRSFTQGNGSTDLRIWDGKQMSSHYKRDEFDTNLYVLKDNPQRSFKHMMLHMEWFRSQPHVFWWNGENEVWPMSYFGNADEFEIVGQENYRGIDCYVLCGDLATSGLSWKWYVGKKDKLLYGKTRLRHGKPDVESWMLDYKEVAPGCLIPMTQGRRTYKWNEAGTSHYIIGPYNLKVAQVRVNEKLEDSLFEMEFVEGVNVQDKRGGMMLEYPYSAERVDRPLEFRKSVLSATNMKYIGRALFNYAMDHDDKFPSKLDELVEKADIHPKTFESPRKPEDFDGPSYIYIAGQAGTSNPNNVIVYENPEYLQKNSDKINVLYCDGHVEAVTADKLIKQLRETYKRLGKNVSEIDNLRWADTVEKTDGNESDTEKIEMLINAVRQAQQPSHTMRISWEEVIPPSAMGVIAGPMSDELMKNGLPWVKCKYKATVSGIRSRIECIQEQYRDLQKEPFAISKETTVFDGLKCRTLQEFILSPDNSITGSQGLKDQNYPKIADSFFGTYFYFKDSNIISKYNPRLIDCDKEGCFMLEVSAPDHIQHFEIDSNKGFNVTKSTIYNGNMLKIKESVIEFGKTAGNIWMPGKRVLTRYMRGKLESRSEIKYDAAEFDIDVSDEIFTLKYPDGARIWDKIIDGWIVIGDQDVPAIEEDVIQERLLSASRLKQLGQAAMLFAEDNDKKLPDKLDDMKPYLPTDEVIEWARENVDYLGAGSRQENILMAYDKTMLETNGYGTMVVYVNGCVEFIGNKMLGQFGVFGSGGEIRYGERIGVEVGSNDGLVTCKSIEFKKEGEFVTAVVAMDVGRWPRGGWDVVLQLLDSQGNEVRSVAERFENSRKTSGAIFVGPQEITFTLGKFSEIEKAVRFKLSIIAADWVKIETRFYLWPADDETVDTFLRTEIFVDEDGQELSEDQIGSGQFSADLSDDNVRQFKELIAELPDGKWLANPKVTVLDTEPARISVTKQRNYISGFGDSKDDSVDPEPIIETLEEGIRMELIPHIAPDGKSIRLDVDLKMTDVGKWVEQSYKNKYPYELPIINSTSIGTLVMIADQKWCLFDLGEMTSDKTADNSGKKSNRVVVFIKATKINLSNDEDFPRAKDTKNSAGKQSSVAVKIPDEKDETSSHDYGDLNKKVSPSDLFAIYRVIGHENTTSYDPSYGQPWGDDYRYADRYGPRRIIFSRKEKDMFDASSPDKYPLDGLILEDAPLITVDDIVSYDWPGHVIHLKPGAIEALPEICRKPPLNGTPFVIVANGQRISLGTFWTNISSFAPNMLTIYLDGLLLNNDLPENAIQIGRSVIVKEGQLPPPDPRLDQRIRNALDSIGKLKEDLPLGVGADGFGGR